MTSQLFVSVIGKSNVGKQTVINSITIDPDSKSEITYQPEDFLSETEKDLKNTQIKFSKYTIHSEDVSFIDTFETNIIIYVNSLTTFDYENDLHIIFRLNNIIKNSSSKKLIVLINNDDDNITFEKSESITLFKLELEKQKIDMHLYDAKKIFINRYIYYGNEYELSNEFNSTIQNYIKMLIGEMAYKKHKISQLKHLEQQNCLRNHFDFDELYESNMNEFGFCDFSITFEKLYSDIIIDVKISSLNKSFNLIKNCATDISTKIILLIELMEHIDEHKMIFDEILEYISNNLKSDIRQKIINDNIDIETISNINEINKYLYDNFQLNLLNDINNEINMLKTNKLIQNFINNYDSNIIKDIYNELTTSILDESLKTSISNLNLSFDAYIKLFDELFKFELNIDIFACALKYCKHYINSKILYENLNFNNLSNKKSKYIKYVLDTYTCTKIDIKSYNVFIQQINNVSIIQQIITKFLMIQKNNCELTITDLRKYVNELDKNIYKDVTIISTLVKKLTDQNNFLDDVKTEIDILFANGQLTNMYNDILVDRKKSNCNENIPINTTSNLESSTVEIELKKSKKKVELSK